MPWEVQTKLGDFLRFWRAIVVCAVEERANFCRTITKLVLAEQ